jgi:hypothetical protein
VQVENEYDDDDDSEDECSNSVDWKLGFVDDPNPALLQAQYFPSKVGGVPIWSVFISDPVNDLRICIDLLILHGAGWFLTIYPRLSSFRVKM